MWRHVRFGFGLVFIFGGERYAEMRWEHTHQDTWLILAGAASLLWITFYYGELAMAGIRDYRKRRKEGKLEEVLRMMNGVYEYTLFYRDLKAGRIEPLPPGEHSESLMKARRVGLWKRNLIAMGLCPKADGKKADDFEWQIYLEWMIPLVEEEGVDAAMKETRQGWDSTQ